MPRSRFNGWSNCGVGVGLRIPHHRHILEEKPVVNWLEIISEDYMVDGGRPLTMLDRTFEGYRAVQDGVLMYLGSVEPLNQGPAEMAEGARTTDRDTLALRPICFRGGVDGRLCNRE